MPLPALDQHPLSKLTPAMSGEQFQRLLEDVVVNGVKTPIMLYEGKILDGVNRYNAAKAAGRVEIPTETFEGTKAEAIRLVMSLNAHRRHMNATQRAMLAAQIFRAAKEQPELFEDRLWPDTCESARRIIERRDRAPHLIWPPREGFPATAPEELRAFARDHGIENVAVEPIGDEQDFDNAAGRAEIDKLVADGFLDPADVPKDEPDADGPVERFSADCGPKIKRPRGRPKNAARAELVASAGISVTEAKRAQKLARDGSDELKRAVIDGTISGRRADAIAKLPKDEQSAAIASKPKPPTFDLAGLQKRLAKVAGAPFSFIDEHGADAAQTLISDLRRAAESLSAELEKCSDQPKEM